MEKQNTVRKDGKDEDTIECSRKKTKTIKTNGKKRKEEMK